MKEFGGLDLNSLPVWVGIIAYIFFQVYKDILKPYTEKRLAAQIESEKLKQAALLEIEKNNREVRKFNEEAARWERLFNYMENKNQTDVLSEIPSERIYILLFKTFAYELLFLLYTFIDENDIKNPIRKKNIIDALTTKIFGDKQDMARLISPFKCKDLWLNQYIKSVDDQHTLDFLEDIKEILFAYSDNEADIVQFNIRKKKDLFNLVLNHNMKHKNEAIDWLKELVIKK